MNWIFTCAQCRLDEGFVGGAFCKAAGLMCSSFVIVRKPKRPSSWRHQQACVLSVLIMLILAARGLLKYSCAAWQFGISA